MKKALVIALFFGLISGLNAQKIITYPVCDNIPHNNDFTVKVRVPGGEWKDLYEYEVLVDAHKVQKSSMVNFEFDGTVEVAVTSNVQKIATARIRPLSYNIPHKITGNTIRFLLDKPADISVEVNGDIFHNLQIFASKPETNHPNPADTNVVYLNPGVHKIDSLYMQSNKSLYLAAGAVLVGKVVCKNVSNVRIFGRGILYHGQRGIEITNSSNVTVEDLIFINPTHYTIFGGQSTGLKIKGIRSFSAKGWADGIDLMSCSDVLVDRVFMRTSDDCIALYGHRWDYYGDCRNVAVQNSTLWADVAHPIMVGTHGNAEPGKSEVLENIIFKNIDILNHDEPQINYQGCMAINVSDENLARNIRFEDIRVEDFQQGQLFNLRVTFNKKYASAPGRGIENVLFKNVTYTGKNGGISILEGYSVDRGIKNIVFDNLVINGNEISGRKIKPGFMKFSDFAKVYEGLFVDSVEYISSAGEMVDTK
ncbi:MAG TPA: glycosyl hydrolase family 28 protein [Paludibacter sp.]|nr:glycosyl hydrolase family 28 protein [Paludibacter sp.]